MSARAQRERQEQIAREMGLIGPPKGENRTSYARMMAMMPKKDPPPSVSPPKPRERHEGCPGGRHKLESGKWCIDGRVWEHAEIANMKRLNVRHGDGTAKKLMAMDALRMLDEALDLDMSTLDVREHTPA